MLSIGAAVYASQSNGTSGLVWVQLEGCGHLRVWSESWGTDKRSQVSCYSCATEHPVNWSRPVPKRRWIKSIFTSRPTLIDLQTQGEDEVCEKVAHEPHWDEYGECPGWPLKPFRVENG